jgi:hypothetical protein
MECGNASDSTAPIAQGMGLPPSRSSSYWKRLANRETIAPAPPEKSLRNGTEEYAKQRHRIRNMTIRVVEIEDQQRQAVFEIYAILALSTTDYNKFNTT